jgi:energy-coupling factor transporter ATP-binding protein EcfA2
MIIKSMNYSQYDRTANEWRLENCSLGLVNLIVGENASGKSKILNIIANLGNVLTGVRPVFLSANYKVEFDSAGDSLIYFLKCDQGAVTEERLNLGRRNLLSRTKDGKGKIYYQRLKRKLNFQPPPEQVVSIARRDSVQHPFLETLYSWGEAVKLYYFGTDMGRNAFAFPVEKVGQVQPKLSSKMTEMVVPTFLEGQKRFPAQFVKCIIRDMHSIGYELTNVFVAPPFGLGGMPKAVLAIHAKEADLHASTSQNDMSQGMFRALSLIIHINYAFLAESPACILVDDIGEGLDYERSAALVKLLIEKTVGTPTQLIMATNDRFVMNNVPLDYWSIIQREGNVSRVLNRRNSSRLFNQFELTGLNNFDFFSSKYYLKKTE